MEQVALAHQIELEQLGETSRAIRQDQLRNLPLEVDNP